MRALVIALMLAACTDGSSVRTEKVQCNAGWAPVFNGVQLSGTCARSCQTPPAAPVACNVRRSGQTVTCQDALGAGVDDEGTLVCCTFNDAGDIVAEECE